MASDLGGNGRPRSTVCYYFQNHSNCAWAVLLIWEDADPLILSSLEEEKEEDLQEMWVNGGLPKACLGPTLSPWGARMRTKAFEDPTHVSLPYYPWGLSNELMKINILAPIQIII